MLEKIIFLYHGGSSVTGQVPSTGSAGTGAWVVVIVFVLILVGIIFWIRKKK